MMAEIGTSLPATFCEGCPFAGNFVGELEVKDITLTNQDRFELCVVEATDRDSQTSERVTATGVIAEADDQSLKELLVGRVRDCTGSTTVVASGSREHYSSQKCRAINGAVVTALIKKSSEEQQK